MSATAIQLNLEPIVDECYQRKAKGANRHYHLATRQTFIKSHRRWATCVKADSKAPCNQFCTNETTSAL